MGMGFDLDDLIRGVAGFQGDMDDLKKGFDDFKKFLVKSSKNDKKPFVTKNRTGGKKPPRKQKGSHPLEEKAEKTADIKEQAADRKKVLQKKAESNVAVVGFDPGRTKKEELQKAILWSEILGEPKCKRRMRRRMEWQYGNQSNDRRG